MKEETQLLLNGGKTLLQISTFNHSTLVYLNLHENENTSVAAGQKVWRRHGGVFMALRSAGERLVTFKHNSRSYTFDPNRVFTPVGIEATMKEYGDYDGAAAKEVENFAKIILNKILAQSPRLLIALHNTSGEYTIVNYERGGPNEQDAAQVFVSASKNKGDFFFTTHQPLFDFLKAGDFNVVLQNKEGVRDDGSLSVAAAAHDVHYVNVEALHDNHAEQERMIEYLVRFPLKV